MHKPLSPNRAGMFLDHAIRCHDERSKQSSIVQVLLPTVTQLPPRVERRYWYGAAAGVLALIVGVVVYQATAPPAGMQSGASRERMRKTAVPGKRAAGTATGRDQTVPRTTRENTNAVNKKHSEHKHSEY
jgi:hypothetical protein